MPGKSHHGKGKRSAQSKKSKAKQRYAAVASPSLVVAQIPKPAAPKSVSTTSASVRTPLTKPPVARYPYITTELKRIGILAGIMLVILIVLALVLP